MLPQIPSSDSCNHTHCLVVVMLHLEIPALCRSSSTLSIQCFLGLLYDLQLLVYHTNICFASMWSGIHRICPVNFRILLLSFIIFVLYFLVTDLFYNLFIIICTAISFTYVYLVFQLFDPYHAKSAKLFIQLQLFLDNCFISKKRSRHLCPFTNPFWLSNKTIYIVYILFKMIYVNNFPGTLNELTPQELLHSILSAFLCTETISALHQSSDDNSSLHPSEIGRCNHCTVL